MRIIETLSESKNKFASENEDMIYYDNDFCVLVDGATSKTKTRYNNKTSGRLTSEIIVSLFRDSKILYSIGAQEATTYIQNQLREYILKNKIDDDYDLCASALIYSKFKHQVWSIGDCQCMINGKLFIQQKRIDHLLGELRSVAIRCLLLSGYSEFDLMKHDLSRTIIEDFLLMQKFLENSDDKYGYSVLSPRGHIPKAVIYDVNIGDEIVFASDGYPILHNTLDKSEEELKKILSEDPLLYKQFAKTKGVVGNNQSFDDRSYIRFVVE